MLEEAAKTRDAQLQNDLTEYGVSLRQGKQEHDTLTAEITSLKARRSNIPAEQIAMRTALCQALGLIEADMPFAGELLQVRDDEREWEGAAERLLRNFGLSLLVPDEHYSAVVNWVDNTHLKGRLVYFRVRQNVRSEHFELHRDSLARKLLIKPDSPFYDWLARELAHRFDLACCVTQEQFRRETRAITRTGQIKAPGERHEKDDRHRLDDRSRYVLGWSNTAKITALENKAHKLAEKLSELASLISQIQAEQTTYKTRLTVLSKLGEYTDFAELDWHSLARELAKLQDEKQQLESASDVLKQLTGRLNEVMATLQKSEQLLEAHKDKRSKIEQKKSDAETLRTQTKLQLDDPTYATHAANFDRLDTLRREALGEHTLTVDSCEQRERDMRDWLQKQIDNKSSNPSSLESGSSGRDCLQGRIQAETSEIDASIGLLEYRNMLHNLQRMICRALKRASRNCPTKHHP